MLDYTTFFYAECRDWTLMVRKRRMTAVKRCGWLLVCLLMTLSLTLTLELGVIGHFLKSDRPPMVQLFYNNKSINETTLSPGENRNISVLVSSDNLTYASSLRLLVSNQTVVNATWLTPGQDLEVLALAKGKSQVFILGAAYGMSWVALVSLQVLVID